MTPRSIFTRLSQASLLLPIITGFANYNKLTLPFRILLYFFVASVGVEIQATVLKHVYKNNMPGLHIFTFVEFLVFSTVYYLHFQKNSIMRFLIIINAAFFTVAAFSDAFFIDGIWNPNTLSRSYSSVSLIVYALIYFYTLFNDEVTHYSWEYPMFWVSIGVLVYFGINMFYFLLNRYLMANAKDMATISMFSHAGTNIIANSLFAQSFRCSRKPKMLL